MLCSKTISRDTGRSVSPGFVQLLIHPATIPVSASTTSHIVSDASQPFLYLELFGMQFSIIRIAFILLR